MGRTIYQRVYTNLVSRMKAGTLKTGDVLPSTRELAKLYKCHRFTIMRVCQDLASEGWIETTPRSRYLVSLKVPITNSAKAKLSHKAIDLAQLAKSIPDFDLEHTRYAIEFWGGQPDLRLFPKDEFRRILSAALKRMKPEQLNYGQTMGFEPCLKEVSEYLRKSRSLIDKEYIMTNGSQEALYLILQAFVKPGDRIAVEKKGYPPAWKLFASLGAILVPIAVDSEGLDTNDLQEKIKQGPMKLIYVTPLHQYPTTVTLSPRRRQSLIQLAEKNLLPILEDDYDHEFHYSGPPPPPLSAETDLGIYICSFSKVLFPGARLGVIGCNSKMTRNILYQKFLISRQTDCLSQLGLSAWIKDGGFERHLRKMRRIYESRCHFMQSELEKMQCHHQLDWQPPNGGMSIWLNTHRDSKKIAEQAKKRGVFFQHESSMDYLAAKGTHLRIGFAGVTEEEIKKGFAILRDTL